MWAGRTVLAPAYDTVVMKDMVTRKGYSSASMKRFVADATLHCFSGEDEQCPIDDADECQFPFGFGPTPHTTRCDAHEALQGLARDA